MREGDHLRFTLQGSDPDGGPVTYSSAALPAGATLDPNTGVFDWAVGYDQAGTLTVPFTVTSAERRLDHADGHLHRPARPRRAGLQPAPELAGQRGAADLLHRLRRRPAQPDVPAADAAAGRLALALPDHAADRHLQRQRPAAGATFDPDTALFRWTPGNHQAGTYNVIFTATNDGNGGPLSSSVTVPITVLNVNHPPVVTPIANITLTAGQPFDQPVQATDPDGNPLTLSVKNGIAGFPLPGFVTFTDNGDGTGVLHFTRRRATAAPTR